MTIEFRCRCGSLLIAEPTGVAQSIRCPMCFELAEVPAAENPAQRPAAPDSPTRVVPSGEMVVAADSVAAGRWIAEGPPVGLKEILPNRIDQRPHLKRLHWTAATTIVAALVQSIPIGCYGDSAAPVWMRVTLILSASQVAFWLWAVLVPDWSTMWIATLLAAGVSTFYAFALAIAVATPAGEPDLLEMNALRDPAQLWLTAMLLVCGTMSLACGQISFQWREDIG